MPTTMTPVTSLPSGSGSLAGSFAPAGARMRLSVALKKGGSDSLIVLRQNGTSYWEPTSHKIDVSRTDADVSGGIASLDVPIETAANYHVFSTSGFAASSSNAAVTLEDLSPPASISGAIPGHSSNHTSSGSDPIPNASADGASGLMSGAQAGAYAASSTTATINRSGAVSITSSGAAVTITANAASTWKTNAGALSMDSAAALNLGGTSATAVNIGRAAVAAAFLGGFTVSSAKQGVIDAGSAMAPGLAVGGSLTTGVYSPGANTLAIAANGAQAVLFDASQVSTFAGDLKVSSKYTIAVASGKVTKYNNESTAGVGQRYIVAAGQDVASAGGGAQNTTVATFTPAAGGLYRVELTASATTTDDTVTAVVTYRDEVMDTAVTLTLMNAVALTHDANAGTAHASALIRAKAGTAILAKITNSAQTTTKLGGVIERVN